MPRCWRSARRPARGSRRGAADHPQTVAEDPDRAGHPGLFTQVHPHLERVLGPRMQHPAALKLLSQFGSPAQIRKAGRRRVVALIHPKAPRMAERLVNEVFTALDEQTFVVPGTDAAALTVPSLATLFPRS